MNGFVITKCPHIIVKDTEQLQREKTEFFGEVNELFYYLLSLNDSLTIVFKPLEKANQTSIGVHYYYQDKNFNLTSLSKSLRYLELNPLDSDTIPQQISDRSNISISRKLHWIPVGNLNLLHDTMDVMTLMTKTKPDGSYIIPSILEIKREIADYKWKHILSNLATMGGSVIVKIAKFTPSDFDVKYALQCLNYYTYTYRDKLPAEELEAKLKYFYPIISKEQIFQVYISFQGEQGELLKLAFTRDVDVKAFDLNPCDRNHLLKGIDLEEKEFISKIGNLWLQDEAIEYLLTPPYTFQDALPGMSHYISKPFIVPYMNDRNFNKTNSLLVGTLSDRSPIHLHLERLRQHLFITGTSGSGKTHTLHHLLGQLPSNIPILIIDPVKREYEEFMKRRGKADKIIDFKDGNFPRFNPFIPPKNITVYSHSAVLSKALALLCPTNDVAFNLILNMVRATYIEKLRLFLPEKKVSLEKFLSVKGAFLRDNPACIPTLDEFLAIGMAWLKKTVGRDNRWGQETIQYFERRWDFIKTSFFKYICDSNRSVEHYFQSDYLIELYGILDADESNAIFALLVALLYEYRMSEGLQNNLQHLLILEEAHRIIPAQQQSLGENRVTSAASEAAKLLAQMLAEIRAYGEGAIVVDQSPSKIISDVLINSSTKIIHRTLYGGDKECLSSALGLTQRERDYLSYLATGEAIAFLADTYQPIYLTVPPVQALNNKFVAKEEL
jgi:energy-coupling factor transporter ATP-binding protein EcfA2